MPSMNYLQSPPSGTSHLQYVGVFAQHSTKRAKKEHEIPTVLAVSHARGKSIIVVISKTVPS